MHSSGSPHGLIRKHLYIYKYVYTSGYTRARIYTYIDARDKPDTRSSGGLSCFVRETAKRGLEPGSAHRPTIILSSSEEQQESFIVITAAADSLSTARPPSARVP